VPRLPWEKFWYDDWKADPALARCRPSSRGVWIDALCFLWHEGVGEYTAEAEEWAVICRCKVDVFMAAVGEFERYKVCDVTVEGEGSNSHVTLKCRRLSRESKKREQNRLRVQRHREMKAKREPVTPPVTRDARARPEAQKPRSPEAISPTPKPSRVPAGPLEYPPEFEELWGAYPRPVGKKAAFAKCRVKLKEGATWERLIAAAENYAKWARDNGKEQTFLKHARTFYGPQDHWEEWVEDIPEGEKPKSGQAGIDWDALEKKHAEEASRER
jgi:hypothetical protein